MEKDQLGFSCPRCGIDLVLPARFSGIEGPCPHCGSVIRAPKIVEQEPEPQPVRLEVQEEPVAPRAKPVAAFQPAAEQYFEPVQAAPAKAKGWVIGVVVLAALVGFVAVLFGIQALRRLPDASAKISRSPSVPAPTERKAVPEPAFNPELDPRVPPEGMDVTALIAKSADVLGKFLGATSLAERLTFVETRTSQEELASGVLARPLTYSSGFSSTEVRFNKVEGASDVVFLVPLGKDNGARESHLIVVRTRGTQEPKVVIDPFLDGFGGRLAEFAEKPVEGEKTFKVVMAAFDFCTDESLPDHANKFTMKISSHPGGPDVAKAYFSSRSPLTEKFPKSLFPFGRSLGATVVLRWSTGDQPFIEVIDIKRLDWDD